MKRKQIKRQTDNKTQTDNKRRGFAIALFLIAALFMAYGIYRGEVSIIWDKAVNICLECIGLG